MFTPTLHWRVIRCPATWGTPSPATTSRTWPSSATSESFTATSFCWQQGDRQLDTWKHQFWGWTQISFVWALKKHPFYSVLRKQQFWSWTWIRVLSEPWKNMLFIQRCFQVRGVRRNAPPRVPGEAEQPSWREGDRRRDHGASPLLHIHRPGLSKLFKNVDNFFFLSYIYTGQVFPSCFENCCQIEILGDRFQECLCGGTLQGSRQVVAKLHFVTRSFIGFPLVPEKTLAKYNHENILLLIGWQIKIVNIIWCRYRLKYSISSMVNIINGQYHLVQVPSGPPEKHVRGGIGQTSGGLQCCRYSQVPQQISQIFDRYWNI